MGVATGAAHKHSGRIIIRPHDGTGPRGQSPVWLGRLWLPGKGSLVDEQGEPAPAPYGDKIPKDFSALTDLWENEQGVMGASSKRLIVFAPDGPGWTDISGVWENVVHHPSKAGEGLSDVDYSTIIDSIANSV